MVRRSAASLAIVWAEAGAGMAAALTTMPAAAQSRVRRNMGLVLGMGGSARGAGAGRAGGGARGGVGGGRSCGGGGGLRRAARATMAAGVTLDDQDAVREGRLGGVAHRRGAAALGAAATDQEVRRTQGRRVGDLGLAGAAQRERQGAERRGDRQLLAGLDRHLDR